MLKIKLTRLGKKKEPRYRIVVNEARDKRDGQYVTSLGIYQPAETPKILELDIKAYESWIAKGAQATSTVAWLYEQAKNGKGLPDKKKPKLNKKARAKLAAAAQESAAAEPAEVKTEETTAETTAEIKVEETAAADNVENENSASNTDKEETAKIEPSTEKTETKEA